jgi:CheY-like chemotaxis protein
MKNILVVDDNKIFRESLASYIRSRLDDYQVLTAEDGAAAIRLLEANPVRLVLTDLVMPNVDGYKVIAYARQKHPSIPVIIMTATWSLELDTLIRKIGVTDYMDKPFRLEDIDRLVIGPLKKNDMIAETYSCG